MTVFEMRKDTYVWHADSIREARTVLTDALKKYEETYPYRYGMKKAEVQTTYFQKIRPNVFDRIVEYFVSQGDIRRVEEFLCTPEYEVRKDGVYQKVSAYFLDTFEKAGFDFVRYSEIDMRGTPKETADDILNILITEGEVVRVTEEMYTLARYMEEAKEKIKAHLAEDPLITIAQVRDMFQTSRKSAKPILEYMDALKITKKMARESERVAY